MNRKDRKVKITTELFNSTEVKYSRFLSTNIKSNREAKILYRNNPAAH
jgi:hypothetical protein